MEKSLCIQVLTLQGVRPRTAMQPLKIGKNNKNSEEVVHHEILIKNVIHNPLSKDLE